MENLLISFVFLGEYKGYHIYKSDVLDCYLILDSNKKLFKTVKDLNEIVVCLND